MTTPDSVERAQHGSRFKHRPATPRLSRFLATLLLLFSISCGGGQQPNSRDETTPETVNAQTAQARPLLLWEVSRDGLPSSWLFGTCHAGVLLEESLPDARRELVEQASLRGRSVSGAIGGEARGAWP